MRGASGAALAALALLAGCGGAGTPTATRARIPLTPQERHGRQLFLRDCGSCHRLADAGTGGTAGPNLDEHPWREVYVREVIASGPGLMPAGLAGGRDADAISAYLASVSRR